MLFTSVTTNSSHRQDKELLEKETILMETESTRTVHKSASGKANDVNNAKKIKAYIYGQKRNLLHSNICVDKSVLDEHLSSPLLPRPSTIFFSKMKGNTITAILHKKPLNTVFESL
ncbi:BnaC05g48170D [Brassica napus]|uniref:BnaC05g48170D protein n=1 Tax=Brassica napus TaxID=3708 RepID=A0A078IMM2_BRANA|nr:BnaC05g48170D [Brassica napus]